jgi:hypothetical protein
LADTSTLGVHLRAAGSDSAGVTFCRIGVGALGRSTSPAEVPAEESEPVGASAAGSSGCGVQRRKGAEVRERCVSVPTEIASGDDNCAAVDGQQSTGRTTSPKPRDPSGVGIGRHRR